MFSTSSGPWTDGYSTNFRMGLFDWNGNVIFKYGDYKSILYAENGLFILTALDGRIGIYEHGAGITFPLQNQYRSIEALKSIDLFVVQNQTGLVGVIDKSGNQILPCVFEYIPYNSYTQGCFVVRRFTNEDTKKGFQQHGGDLTDPALDRLEDALVDSQGKYLIPFGLYDSIDNSGDGYVRGGMWTGRYKYVGFGGGEFGKIYNYTDSFKLSDLLAEKGGIALPYPLPSTGTDSSAQTPIISNSSSAFTDVKSTDYYSDAVQWAVEKNITSGTSKTTFSPNNTCSNAEILTFLWRANGSPEPTAANPFDDIKATDYFYKAALWAAEKGLVSGSTFGANTDCTRAMTMEYMWKAAGCPAASYNGKFNDVPANSDYAQAVAWAVENKITSGTGSDNFSPDATCTRGQIVAFLHRAMGK